MRRTFVSAVSALVSLSPLLAFALLLPALAHADSKASSRIRDIPGRREIRVASVDSSGVLDTLAARGVRSGYTVTDLDREHARIVLERAMPAGEAALLRTPPDGTERARLRFEIVHDEKEKGPGLTIVGAIVIVSNPGSSGELMLDLGKRDPYRDELKSWMEALRASFTL